MRSAAFEDTVLGRSVRSSDCGAARCSGCGTSYPADRWSSLCSLETLHVVDILAHVVAWPKGDVIEVRSCDVCGKTMARRRSVG
jgi:hypothetical protein